MGPCGGKVKEGGEAELPGIEGRKGGEGEPVFR